MRRSVQMRNCNSDAIQVQRSIDPPSTSQIGKTEKITSINRNYFNKVKNDQLRFILLSASSFASRSAADSVHRSAAKSHVPLACMRNNSN